MTTGGSIGDPLCARMTNKPIKRIVVFYNERNIFLAFLIWKYNWFPLAKVVKAAGFLLRSVQNYDRRFIPDGAEEAERNIHLHSHQHGKLNASNRLLSE